MQSTRTRASPQDSPPLEFASVARFRHWLARNHARPDGAWLLLAKKGTPRGLRYPEALEEALCWGWIDGKLHAHDHAHYALWFSPRRPKSIWSLANRKSVERLMSEGRMQPPGLARVQEAKANGRWEAASGAKAIPRLTSEIRLGLERAGAFETFQALSPSRRTQLLGWVGEAKRAETRERRIAALPALARENRPAGFARR